MSQAKTPKLGIPDFPPSSHKQNKNENNFNTEDSLRSRDPKYNPDELDSQVKLKKSQYQDESQLSSQEENSPGLISIPTIKKKITSPDKRKQQRKKSPKPNLDLNDLSDER